MRAGMLLTIAVVAVCFYDGAFAGERPHRAQRASVSHAAKIPTAARDSHVDPAAPYKADHLSSFRGQSPLNVPGQTTVLTRDVLDDMNATSLRDALRSTAGVTVR
jgi:outer membrane receptor for monomeric catechols